MGLLKKMERPLLLMMQVLARQALLIAPKRTARESGRPPKPAGIGGFWRAEALIMIRGAVDMKKLKGQRGFTLVEMLIVVAIIAVLVAVSIPVVNTSLERARQAVDAANERAAKMEIILCYLTDSEYTPGKKVVAFDDDTVKNTGYAYDAASGTLTQTAPDTYGKCSKHKDKYLLLWIYKSGEVKMLWGRGAFPATITESWADPTDLCSNALNS